MGMSSPSSMQISQDGRWHRSDRQVAALFSLMLVVTITKLCQESTITSATTRISMNSQSRRGSTTYISAKMQQKSRNLKQMLYMNNRESKRRLRPFQWRIEYVRRRQALRLEQNHSMDILHPTEFQWERFDEHVQRSPVVMTHKTHRSLCRIPRNCIQPTEKASKPHHLLLWQVA